MQLSSPLNYQVWRYQDSYSNQKRELPLESLDYQPQSPSSQTRITDPTYQKTPYRPKSCMEDFDRMTLYSVRTSQTNPQCKISNKFFYDPYSYEKPSSQEKCRKALAKQFKVGEIPSFAELEAKRKHIERDYKETINFSKRYEDVKCKIEEEAKLKEKNIELKEKEKQELDKQ